VRFCACMCGRVRYLRRCSADNAVRAPSPRQLQRPRAHDPDDGASVLPPFPRRDQCPNARLHGRHGCVPRCHGAGGQAPVRQRLAVRHHLPCRRRADAGDATCRHRHGPLHHPAATPVARQAQPVRCSLRGAFWSSSGDVVVRLLRHGGRCSRGAKWRQQQQQQQ
jgi:hypothetical protein